MSLQTSPINFKPALQPTLLRPRFGQGDPGSIRKHTPAIDPGGPKNRSGLAMGLSKLVGLAFYPIMGVNSFDTNRFNVNLTNLPESWKGAKVVQIGDLHDYELLDPKYLDKVVKKVQDEQPDLVIFSGDLIHHSPKFLDHAREQFLERLLKPRADGSKPQAVACMGNHDYMDDADGVKAKAAMEAAGFKVLVNNNIELKRDGKGEPLVIAAVDDFHYGHHDIDGTLSDKNARPHIVLSHNPRHADAIARHKNAPSLILAGDTHGGHFFHWSLNWLRSGVFKKKIPKYRVGWYPVPKEENGTKTLLYVNSGLGSAFFSKRNPKYDFAGPPLRLGSKPEVTVFTLGRTDADPSFERIEDSQ
jgi:uncharacterized protein